MFQYHDQKCLQFWWKNTGIGEYTSLGSDPKPHHLLALNPVSRYVAPLALNNYYPTGSGAEKLMDQATFTLM